MQFRSQFTKLLNCRYWQQFSIPVLNYFVAVQFFGPNAVNQIVAPLGRALASSNQRLKLNQWLAFAKLLPCDLLYTRP